MAAQGRYDEPGSDDTRPWEQPGVARRDCAPHRANWLLVLGGASAAWSCLAALPTVVLLPKVTAENSAAQGGPALAPGGEAVPVALLLTVALVGTVLGAVAYALARADLARMRRGLMDPGGMGMVKLALACALVGTGVGLCQLAALALALAIS